MKIPAGKADQYTNKFAFDVVAVLLYGPDVGLVSERAEIISKQVVEDLNDPFACINISADRLKEETSAVLDEYCSFGLMGGRKLIRIKNGDNAATKAIKNLSESGEVKPGQALVIVTAGDLTPKSSLRQLFESAKNLSAVPCYVDDPQALQRIVATRLNEAGYKFSHDIPAYIAQHCQGDRLIIKQEIEKLSLYMGDKKDITMDDVQASVGQVTESTLDDICHAVADGNYTLAEKHYSKAINQGIVPVAVLRTLERYFLRIKKVRSKMKSGIDQEKAMQSLRPPIFFKNKSTFNRHLASWGKNSKKLDIALDVLYKAEVYTKKTGSLPELIGGRCLMKLSQLGKRG